jgi:hypothetical protein
MWSASFEPLPRIYGISRPCFLGKLKPGFEHILWFLQHVETQFWTSAENIGNNETLFWTYVLVLNLYCSFYGMCRASFEPVPIISGISRPYFEPMLRHSQQIQTWFWICCDFLGISRCNFEPPLRPLGIPRPCFEPLLTLSYNAEIQYWNYVGTSLASLNLVMNLLSHYLLYQDLIVNLCWDFVGISRLSFEPMLQTTVEC